MYMKSSTKKRIREDQIEEQKKKMRREEASTSDTKRITEDQKEEQKKKMRREEASTSATSDTDWSNLPSDILLNIAELLLINLTDYVRFRAVCQSWRSATLDPKKSSSSTMLLPPHHLPWVTLGFEKHTATWGFLSPSDNKIHQLSLQPIFNTHTKIISSFNGWLVGIDNAAMVTLLNPLTMTVIPLPPFTTLCQYFMPMDFKCDSCYEDNDWFDICIEGFHQQTTTFKHIRDRFLSKVIVSADGTVVGYCCIIGKFVFARPGREENKWMTADDHLFMTKGIPSDILAYLGSIYAIDVWGQITRACRRGIWSPITTRAHRRGIWSIVESSSGGELLLVCRDYILSWGIQEDILTSKIEVYKLDYIGEGAKLVQVKSLGDQILFLGVDRSMCFTASNLYPEWKRNHIYISYHYFDDPYIYNLEDDNIKLMPCHESFSEELRTAIWFTPNLCNSRAAESFNIVSPTST